MAAQFKYLGGYPYHIKSMWGAFSPSKDGFIFSESGLRIRENEELNFPYKCIENIQLEQASNPNISALITTGLIGLVWKNKVLVVSFIYKDSIPCNAAFQEKSTEITGQMRRAYNNLTDGWHNYLSLTGSKPATMPSSSDVPVGDTRKCPLCAETIKAEAKICRYCGNTLPSIAQVNMPTESPKLGGIKEDQLDDFKDFYINTIGETAYEEYLAKRLKTQNKEIMSDLRNLDIVSNKIIRAGGSLYGSTNTGSKKLQDLEEKRAAYVRMISQGIYREHSRDALKNEKLIDYCIELDRIFSRIDELKSGG